MLIRRKFFNHQAAWKLAFISALGAILFLHIWQLDFLPRGLYVDESSIGLNAALIKSSLRDEHGVLLPAYFEAFGEYKNPVYIYSTAILFSIFGVNDFALRATSFIYFILLLAGLVMLVRKLFPQNSLLLIYTIISTGFLPWLFSLSRISFEVITQPAILIWVLYLIVHTYTSEQSVGISKVLAFASGVLIGASVYTYSTGRLLSFILFLSVFVAFYQKKYWQRHLFLLFGALISLIPYLTFSIQNPDALTHRFGLITFIFNAQLSVWDKIIQFLTNYFSYFSINFLLVSGDLNLRHHIGMGGEIYITVFILFILGAWAISANLYNPNSDKRLFTLLAVNMISAPAAAALTEANHSLRSVLLAIYIIIFSVYGLAALQRLKHIRLRYISIVTLSVVMLAQIILYIVHYFIVYPVDSIRAFESYDFKTVLTRAINYKPNDIIVSKYANQPYAHLDYYRHQVDTKIPIYVSEPIADSRRCIIYFQDNEYLIDNKGLQVGIHEHSNYSHLRCYR